MDEYEGYGGAPGGGMGGGAGMLPPGAGYDDPGGGPAPPAPMVRGMTSAVGPPGGEAAQAGQAVSSYRELAPMNPSTTERLHHHLSSR